MKYINSIIYLIAFTILFSSCEKEILTTLDPAIDEETVDVKLNLGVELYASGTSETSASAETKTGANEPMSTIENLWVLQINGTGDTDKIIGTPIYIADYAEGVSIQLVQGSNHTIIYIANSFNSELNFLNGMTMADVKIVASTISSSEECYKTIGSNSYYIMNGSVAQTISLATKTLAPCTLKRNIAKIEFTLKNTLSSEITVNSVQLINIPTKSYFYNSYNSMDDTHIMPDINEVSYINYKKNDVNTTSITSTEGETFTYYMPINKRGISTSTSQENKPALAPLFASYILVNCTYLGHDVNYSFYLGKDLTNDFNINPNTRYCYTIEITKKGNPITDHRIQDLGDVDFTSRKESSNCYILNPTSASRSFYIPIQNRINEYWGTDYANVPTNMLSGDDSNWEPIILWHDCDLPVEGEVVINKVTGKKNDQQYIEVVLPKKYINYGNISVGIRRTGEPKTLLWSWHLWITDYNPDVAHTPQANIKKYNVSNGEIHRYKWTLPEHNSQFIMDRNVGARDTGYGYKGVIVYQFGRKDPYPLTEHVSFTSGYELRTDDITEPMSLNYGVNNPTHFLIDHHYNWTSEVDSLTYQWHDVNLRYGVTSKTKSIFDPSPLGWRLPKMNIWRNILNNNTAKWINNDFKGIVYDSYAYYPAYSYSSSTQGATWSSEPYEYNVYEPGRTVYGKYFIFRSTDIISVGYGTIKRLRNSIRSIRDI